MAFTVVALAVAFLASYWRGGRFYRLPRVELRALWLLGIGVVVQVLVDLAAAQELAPAVVTTSALLGSEVLVLTFVVLNRQRPGMVLIGIGFLLNAAVILANGAMPVDPAAMEVLGVEGVPPGKHELLTERTLLPWLADRIPVPPIRTIISIGDLVIAAGLIPLVHDLMRSRHDSTQASDGADGRARA